jgi:hypothetical protein
MSLLQSKILLSVYEEHYLLTKKYIDMASSDNIKVVLWEGVPYPEDDKDIISYLLAANMPLL